MSKHRLICFLVCILFIIAAKAQQRQDSLLTDATLQQCVQYALTHQPRIQQSLIDEAITEANIKTRLADWYPQVNLAYTAQHYFKTPIVVINGTPVSSAAKNFSTANFSLTQNIFNRDVLLASRTARDVRTATVQVTTTNKIYLTLGVSKAFYDVLLSAEQVSLAEQDITRLSRSVKDAYNQYKGGITDKTDYKRAQILLNIARAQKKQYREAVTAKFSTLKLLMGYPQKDSFALVYDSVQLRNEIYIDTLQEVNYTGRIEYRLLQTQQNLLQSNLKYYKWGFLPNVSAFGNYNFIFANNKFSKLYSRTFPNSYFGLSLGLPIFQGFKRTWQIRSARLTLNRLQYNFQSLQDSIQSEYTQALAGYKSVLNDYYVQRDNLELATDVYNTINLQYKSGIKTYLEVIIAESDLRTTRVNYLNALYQVLSSKLDVQKALGILTY